MLEFFANASVLPFSVALGMMVGLFVIELFATVIGFHPIDSFLPDFDADAGAEGAGLEMQGWGFGSLLGWFHFGRVPALLILSLGLAGFGTVGTLGQLFAHKWMGAYLPLLMIVPLGILGAVLLTRYGGLVLAQIMPRDESNVVSRDKFVGQLAKIVHGTASQERKAEACLVDAHGISHYFLVQPAADQTEIAQGEEVLIVAAEEAHYVVVRANVDVESAV